MLYLQKLYQILVEEGISLWRHRKRSSPRPYVKVGEGTAQCSQWDIREGDPVTVYMNDSGELYVRHSEEFNDGRFYQVDSSKGFDQ